jgi:hypothetical protein
VVAKLECWDGIVVCRDNQGDASNMNRLVGLMVSLTGYDDLIHAVPRCAQYDCRKSYFMREVANWIKIAIRDIGESWTDSADCSSFLNVHQLPLLVNFLWTNKGLFFTIFTVIVGLAIPGGIIPIILNALGGPVLRKPLRRLFSRINEQFSPEPMATLLTLMNRAHIGSHTTRKLIEAAVGLASIAFSGPAKSFVGSLLESPARASGDWRTWELDSRVDNYPKSFAAQMVR